MFLAGSRVGIDFHGCITDNPEYFKKLILNIQNNGGSVFIITGCGTKSEEIERTLAWIYNLKICIPIQNIIFTGAMGYTANFEWTDSKLKFCYENQINYLIDNDKKFLEGANLLRVMPILYKDTKFIIFKREV